MLTIVLTNSELTSFTINDVNWSDYLLIFNDITIDSNSYINFKKNVANGLEYMKRNKVSLGISPYLHVSSSAFNELFTENPKYYSKVYKAQNLGDYVFKNYPDNSHFSWIEKEIINLIEPNENNKDNSWIYSSKGAIEALFNLKNGYRVEIDTQNILFCTIKQSMFDGDNFNSPYHFFEYSIDNPIIISDYRTGSTDDCISNSMNSKYRRNIEAGNLRGLFGISIPPVSKISSDCDIYNGPIVVELSLDPFQMQYYDGLLITSNKISNFANYYGLIVGYGKEKGQSYWIIQTSLGSSWGDNGCIKMNINSDSIISGYQIEF